MIFQKNDKKSVVNPVRSNAPTPAVFLWDLWRLAWISAAIFLLIALLTHAPTDPSWSTWSSRSSIQNWMGRLGSIAADLSFQLMGLAAFGVAILLGAYGMLSLRRATDPVPKKHFAWGPLFFLISLSTLLQCLIPHDWRLLGLKHPGGVIGSGIRQILLYLSGSLGAVLISSCLFVAALIVTFQRQFLSDSLDWFKIVSEKAKALFKVSRERIALMFKKPVVAPVTGMPFAIPHGILEPEPSAAPPVAPVAAKPTALPIADQESSSRDLDELSRMFGSSKIAKEKAAPKAAKPTFRISKNFQLPQLQMLTGRAENKVKSVDKNWFLEKGNILVQKLKDFGVEGEVVNISPGPVITVYEFKPASGVKIKEIANLSDDLTLALSVLSVRIVAPIPGKPVVGIEIPSPYRETVYFKDMIQETPFYNGDIRIPVVLGRLASGEPVAADLASMPHLLVAGTTGTGKSVFINTLISSLIFRFTPTQLKLILVDPKMVELSHYEGIPHLLLPVVVDSKKAVLALRWAVEEMERRYSKMHQFGVRHVDAYNEKLGEVGAPEGSEEHAFLPYIVVVIDEYADLMAVVPKDVELSIARLAQKARASGIHLVLATQRPSTDVVTGTIKANFPSRISFRVASSIDSKTILDRTGADRLLGHGDMLFHSAGFSSLKRMQGSFISDADTARVVEYLKSQGEPEYNEKILEPLETESTDWTDESVSEEERDGRLFDAAVKLVTDKGEASISLIQRHLKIGYNRAATLMEQLEAEGIVAQPTGASKRRAVLVNNI